MRMDKGIKIVLHKNKKIKSLPIKGWNKKYLIPFPRTN